MEGIRQDEISNGLLENLCVTRFKWLRRYIVRVYTRWLLPKIRTTVRQLTDDHMILVSGEIHPGLNVQVQRPLRVLCVALITQAVMDSDRRFDKTQLRIHQAPILKIISFHSIHRETVPHLPPKNISSLGRQELYESEIFLKNTLLVSQLSNQHFSSGFFFQHQIIKFVYGLYAGKLTGHPFAIH